MLMMHGSHIGVHGDALRQHVGVHANDAWNPYWRTW